MKGDLIKTGVSGLDAILSGGIPRGNIILLEGGDRHGQDDARRRVRLSGRQPVRRAGRHRPVRGVARQADPRRGGARMGSPGA